MDVDKIIDQLYEGTLDPAAWDRALLSIADEVRASGAMLFAFNPSTGALLRDERHRVDPVAVSEYERYWNEHDIRRPYVFDLPVGEPGTELSLRIPVKRSRIYSEYLLPVDMPHFMPVWLHKSERKAVALSMQGSLKRGPFSPDDVRRLRQFVPHLCRTLEIRDRLEAAQIRATSLARTLDAALFGVLVLDASRRIVECNAVASALLTEERGLKREHDGTLRLPGVPDEQLARWLRCVPSRPAPADALLRLPRAGQLPLSILAAPVTRASTAWISGDPTWILLVFDPERHMACNRQMIGRDLGLSDCEAHVVALLAAGLNVATIATRLHVTVNTVRTQLQAAYQKTGCHTQAEIVRRVLLGPGFTALS